MNKPVCYDEKPWFSHYEADVPEQIDYEAICLPDILERSAERYPDRMALQFEGYRITFRELKQMVDRFAAVLHQFGIRKGDRVAILLQRFHGGLRDGVVKAGIVWMRKNYGNFHGAILSLRKQAIPCLRGWLVVHKACHFVISVSTTMHAISPERRKRGRE